MAFWWIIVHNLICSIHSSHKFIIVVSYLWLHFSYFHFVCSLSTIFAVWRVEINFTSRLCHHTWSEIGLYISKQTVPFSCILFFPSFPWSLIEVLNMHEVNIRWWTELLVSTIPWYHAIKCLAVGVCERLCLQNICRWQSNPIARINEEMWNGTREICRTSPSVWCKQCC